MEFIDAVKELGILIVLAVIGALIVWSNSRSNEQQSKNMGGVIKLSGSIASNSDRVSNAVEKFANVMEKALTTISTSLKTAEAKAIVDEDARAQNAKDINTQLTNITAVLNALTEQCRNHATKEDIFNLAGTLDVLNAISETLAEIKVKLGNNV